MEINSNKAGIARSPEENRALSKALQAKDTQTSSSTARLDLKEGQQVKGTVLDLRYNEVKLQLEPGKQIVTAGLSGEVALTIGEEANFFVTEDGANHLVLKYLPEDIAPTDTTILKALTASGLPLTDRNKTILSELLKHRMPIDKQTLQTLIKAAVTNRSASPQSLVLMHKNAIPLTASNIRQFEAYQSGTGKLLTDIQNITKSLTELFALTGEAEADMITPMASNTVTSPGGSAIPAPFLTPSVVEAVDESLTPSGAKASDQTTTQTPAQVSAQSASQAAALNAFPGDLLQVPDAGQSIALSINDTLIQILLRDQEAPMLSDFLNATEQADLEQLIRQLPEGSPFVKLSEGSASVSDILKFIAGKLPEAGKEAAKALLQSPEYAKLLTEAFHQRWTITPEKLEQKGSVSELYRKLQDDMEALHQLGKSEGTLLESLKLQEPVKNLQENLHFMKDLNQIFTYLQLPVQIENQDIHSELYVFTNKRAIKAKKDLSVLLHLDMPNLGALNIHVTLEHNIVNAKFYPEEKAANLILTEHVPSLGEALKKKGYTFHYEVLDAYKKPDFVKDFIEQNAEGSSPARYSFDIRA